MTAVQHTQLHLFIGQNVGDKHGASPVPLRPPCDKIIFDDPLTEIFTYHTRGIGLAGFRFDQSKRLFRHCRNNPVHHRSREGDVLRNPVGQPNIPLRGEGNNGTFRQRAILRDVIA